MAFPHFYREIGDAFVQELHRLLREGEQVALFGPRRGGKSLLLRELEYQAQAMPAAYPPRIVTLTGFEHRRTTELQFLHEVATRLKVPNPQEVHQGVRLSSLLSGLVLEAVGQSRSPLWIFIKDVLDFPSPIARELLQALQNCHGSPGLRRRLAAVVTGTADFIPLTYGSLSPFRGAKKFLVLGLDQEHTGLIFARQRAFQREGGPPPRRAGFEPIDVGREIDSDGLEHLYTQTGGSPHLVQQIVANTTRYPHAGLAKAMTDKWTRADAEAMVDHFVENHMREDFFCRGAVREIERDRDSFDVLLKILNRGDGQESIHVPVHPLEVAGLARREKYSKARISCPMWRAFLEDFLDGRRVADVYAAQHRWDDAWKRYANLTRGHPDRPVSGDSVERLREALTEWEDSLADVVPKGPEEVCRQFFLGARYLLRFDAGGMYDGAKQPPARMHVGPDGLRDEEPYLPSPDEKPLFQDAEGRRYWLDKPRLRVHSPVERLGTLPLPIRPLLYLGRDRIDRTIDSTEQQYLWKALRHFWDAYIRAQEIAYANSIGRLREKHLRVIEKVNLLLLEEPFDMRRVVQGAADALVEIAQYYRVQFCLVDAKGEWIQAVACRCREEDKEFDFPTNFPLASDVPLEDWDIQCWVVSKGEMCVIRDACDPQQRNPRVQLENCIRLGMKAITVVPMKIGETVLGTIHFELSDKEVPTEGEQELFRILAGQLAVAFHQAQRLTLLQGAVLNLGDQIRVLNPKGRVVFLNRAAAGDHPDVVSGWQHQPFDPRLRSSSDCEVPDRGRLIAEAARENRQVRHYYLVDTEKTRAVSDWLIAPIDDFRATLAPPFSGADGRIGYIERVHDVTEIYRLYEASQSWLREEGVEATARRILDFFRQQGYLWCRLYLKRTELDGSEVLVSFQEFGLLDPNKSAAFRRGEIRFPRNAPNPQPWHMILEVKGPAIYEFRPGLTRPVEGPEDWKGFPRYWSQVIEYEKELEKMSATRWIEAPLLVGVETIGKLSLSVSDDLRALRAEQWELLRFAILGVAVALQDAMRAEREASRAAEETWKMAAAQALHQLVNKLDPVRSWVRYAEEDLAGGRMEEARRDIARAERGVQSGIAILNDFRRYASDKPFEDTQRMDIALLVEKIADDVRHKQPQIGAVRGNARIKGLQVEVSLDAVLELFEILTSNSLVHGGLPPEALRVTVEAQAPAGAAGKAPRQLEHVSIVYRDNGRGIPAQDRDKVFDAFYSTNKLGTGLGLTIARRYVRRHGGDMTAADPAGAGACFHICLPVCRI